MKKWFIIQIYASFLLFFIGNSFISQNELIQPTDSQKFHNFSNGVKKANLDSQTPQASKTSFPPQSTPTPLGESLNPVEFGTPLPTLKEKIHIDNLEKLTTIAEFQSYANTITKIPQVGNKRYIFYSEGIRIEDLYSKKLINKISIRPYFQHFWRNFMGSDSWISITADGSLIAMLSDELSIVIVNQFGELIDKLECPAGEPSDIFLEISPNGKYLAFESRSRDLFLKIYDISEKKFFNIPQYDVTQIGFSPDNKYLFISESNNSRSPTQIKVLEAPDWKTKKPISMGNRESIETWALIPGTSEIAMSNGTTTVFFDYQFEHETNNINQNSNGFSQDSNEYKENPTLSDWGGSINVSENQGGVFRIINREGRHILQISSSNDEGYMENKVNCEIDLSGSYTCQKLSDNRKFLYSGQNKLSLQTKIDTSRIIATGQIQIYLSNSFGNTLLGTVPELGQPFGISEKYQVIFYQPVDPDSGQPKLAATYYNFDTNKVIISFDTAGKDVAGNIPENSPYAITIINNYSKLDDLFQVVYLDELRENFVGVIGGTKNNISTAFAMDSTNSFFVLSSTYPQTKKDQIIFDHVRLYIINMNDLKNIGGYELPPISHPSIPEYNRDLDVYANSVSDMAISSDGKMVALGLRTGKVLFVNLSNGSLIYELQAHIAGINALTFSPDGLILATMDENGIIKIFGVNN